MRIALFVSFPPNSAVNGICGAVYYIIKGIYTPFPMPKQMANLYNPVRFKVSDLAEGYSCPKRDLKLDLPGLNSTS